MMDVYRQIFLKNVYHNEDIVLKSEGTAVRTYTYIAGCYSRYVPDSVSSEDIVYNIGKKQEKFPSVIWQRFL